MPVTETTPTSTADSHTAAADTMAATEVVRLSVNLAPDVAGVLKKWTRQKHISITEGIRRAIAVWNFLEEEREKGNRLAVIEGTGTEERIREIIFT